MRKYAGIICVVLTVIFFCGNVWCAEDDADKIVGNVEKTLKKLKTVTCSFERNYHRKVGNRKTILSGNISLKEPDFLRYEDQTKQVVVDGRTVWMYIPRNKQVQISTYIQGEGGILTPKSLFERYSENRKAEHTGTGEVNGEVCDILLLVSSVPAELPVKVWIERERSVLVKSLEETESGDTIEYVLSDIVLNGKIDDDVFVFITPEGVETIDLRD
ncbi:outer membrane lipoprotein carrier protein LolA [Candidatus Latescibacterota bacterium]